MLLVFIRRYWVIIRGISILESIFTIVEIIIGLYPAVNMGHINTEYVSPQAFIKQWGRRIYM